MAYIDAADVKAIRTELKAAFPNCKFSVRKLHGAKVVVTLLSGDVDFSNYHRAVWGESEKFDGYAQINNYHYQNDRDEYTAFFSAILDIMRTAPSRGTGANSGTVWYNNSDIMTDYFDTAYYMNLFIGDWDKPYVFKATKERA